MKTLRFIINPSSGRQLINEKLNELEILLSSDEFVMQKVYTREKNDATKLTYEALSDENVDYIVACGGDGTVNEVAKAIYFSAKRKPFTIIPTGTVNDFAAYLKIPRDMNKFAEILRSGTKKQIDVGILNDEHVFVNVAAGGFMVNVAHETDPEIKAVIGRFAYYLEGAKEFLSKLVTKPEKLTLSVESQEFSGNVDSLFFLVSNSSSIGGFKHAAPYASVSDSLLDVIIIKHIPLIELTPIFLSILNGEHIYSDNVIYFQTKSVKINSNIKLTLDIDGEFAGYLPAKIEVSKNMIEILR